MNFRISRGRKKNSKLTHTASQLGATSQSRRGPRVGSSGRTKRQQGRPGVNPYLLEKMHIQREEEKIKEAYFREWG